MHFGEGSNADAEDEVVASYSIFLSSSLAKNLHIFQYPLRRKDRPYEADDVKVFCTDGERETTEHREGSLRKANDSVIDPNSRLTMRCTLDTFGSPSFCAASGYDSSMIDSKNAYSYALQSHPFQCRSDYVIGCISSDGIHITPASSVHQFTPALCANDQQGATLVGDAYCSSQSTPLLVMSTPDRVQRELLRQRSAMLNADAATAKELKFFGSNTIESNAVCRRLLSVTHERPSPSGRREIANIENILFPPEILVSGGIVGGEEVDAYSMIHRFADRFSISFQVQHLIHRCQILPLSVLSDYIVPQVNAHATAPPNVPDFELIDALRTCAIYMHGVWVSRQCSQFKGSAAAIREVVLLTFHESDDGTVSRRDLNSLVGTSSFARQSVKDVLESIAVLNASEPQMSKRRWRLRYVSERRDERVCSAEAFRNTFPADEAAQLSHWMKAAPLVRQHISFLRTNRTPPRLHLIWSQATDNAACSSPQRMEARSASFSETELTPIRQYINALFLEHGVLNKQRVKEMVMKGKDANYPSASNQMLSEALKGCVQPFTSSTWVLRTLNEPTVDRYRPYLLACILELQQFEITALASRVEESIVQSGTQIAVPVERGIIQRVLSEVAEFKSGERLWHIKSGNASE